MSHTVTVTKIPDDESDDVEYTIGGTHDQSCLAYQDCLKSWHRHPKNEEIVGDEWGNERVGYHSWIEGEWMVPMKNRCGFDIAFEYDNPEFQMNQIGTYSVEVDWDGDWWIAALTHIDERNNR